MYRNVIEIKELYNLTDLEAEILDLLFRNPNGLSAKDVIKNFPKRGENVYRPLEKLVKIGIVEETDDWPRKYTTKNLNKKLRETNTNRMFTFPYANNSRGIIQRITEPLRRFLRRFRK
jgi:Fe2+ or Zn2+ uptake regulation protein